LNAAENIRNHHLNNSEPLLTHIIHDEMNKSEYFQTRKECWPEELNNDSNTIKEIIIPNITTYEMTSD